MWLAQCGGAELSFLCGLVAVGVSLFACRDGPAMGRVAAPGTLWVDLECGQHLREARRCPVPLALPMGDLPLGDPQLAGSSEHSITLGVHTD